jgi:hypothetical protein
LPNIEKWTYQKGEGYDDLEELYNEVLLQYRLYLGHVTTNIGGMNENFKTYDQSGPVYTFVPKDRQQSAIAFLNKQLFAAPYWLIDGKELAKFDNGIMINRIKALQTNTLQNVLTPPRLSRMYDNEAKNGAAAYTVADLFIDLRPGIFGSGKPDLFKRNLQRAYIEDLKSLLNDEYRGLPNLPAASQANYGFTPINLVLSDVRPMVRAELKLIDSKLPKGGDALTAAHYADIHLRIKEALNPTRPIVNLPPATPGRGVADDLPKEGKMEPNDMDLP